jgi:hypothetical protein
MLPTYELAYALASGSLSLFVGTGFSKHLTDGKAPDWQTLLQRCCRTLRSSEGLFEELFPDGRAIMPLEECASVISLQMIKEGKSLYVEIAAEVKKLKVNPMIAKPLQDFALKHATLKFITTNYDHLIEDGILKGRCTSFAPGSPISRQRIHHEIFHIHGSYKLAEQMVVTADDYYAFINSPNYFSKKLDSLLEENTTIIIGYSLGDINFKSILNAHRYSGARSINRQHLFYLSRAKIAQHVKDYYDASYGLRVIDETSILELIKAIDEKYDLIEPSVKKSKDLLQSVLDGKETYKDAYLKQDESFSEILATISSTGLRVESANVIKLFETLIQRKLEFTQESGAFLQYDHLAGWLIRLGCVMDLDGTPLKEVYLSAVKSSFRTMSRKKEKGYSWAAYSTWKNNWGQLTYKNRVMLRKYVNDHSIKGDCESVVNQ